MKENQVDLKKASLDELISLYANQYFQLGVNAGWKEAAELLIDNSGKLFAVFLDDKAQEARKVGQSLLEEHKRREEIAQELYRRLSSLEEEARKINVPTSK